MAIITSTFVFIPQWPYIVPTVPLQLSTTHSSSICVLVCSVIYSCVLRHSHCISHILHEEAFEMLVPLICTPTICTISMPLPFSPTVATLQFPLLRLVQVLSSGQIPNQPLEVTPYCHAVPYLPFLFTAIPPPPHTHTQRTHTCMCTTKLHLYRCPHVPIHTIAPTNGFLKQASPLSFLNGPRHAP